MPLAALNLKKLRSSLVMMRLATPEAPPADVQVRARVLINGLLAKRGLDPTRCCDSDGTFWLLPLDPVPVAIRLIRVDAEVKAPDESGKASQSQAAGKPDDFIEVFARVMRLPSHPLLAVYRFLLETNMRLIGTAFAIEEGHILLRSQRRIDGLDDNELEEMISAICAIADGVIPLMQEQFSLGVVSA